ncbi:Modification methylase DpnIIA [Novipirellula galeiformis]|uniref:Site-specific DNA-methyltransferase (adenine-specific) n=1 Tax=Novipirellula galeiformis TaxID=2528004 RepID=A0A5C6CNZ2_9BACT|nr:Dam family site-specific DNA-(adenine-N6)-methyltransferase [Novipirellula galeiformis]TWU25327.1 Modification methylase DpnIIA [Novipirellula galeiformis]
MIESKEHRIRPFIKWAGGKRWMIDHHSDLFDVDFDRLVEPFLGSGAVFFGLAPKRALLADSNPQLIETYMALRDDWKSVRRNLIRHQQNHCTDYYYRMRSFTGRTPATRAARFIYLNRTCWNGLYRVNQKGHFNVPIGTRDTVLFDSDDFESVSRRLSGVKIATANYSETMKKTRKGDFVFVDPPYTVKHNTNGFIKYNESLFSWEDQEKLRDAVSEAVCRGAKVLVTNAYHKSVLKLYRNMGTIRRLSRMSSIAGASKSRGQFDEMVVQCFG